MNPRSGYARARVSGRGRELSSCIAASPWYGSGAAARGNGELLATLAPSPAFEKLVEASGGYGERVEKPAEIAPALKRALDAVTREKRQALLNVICRY